MFNLKLVSVLVCLLTTGHQVYGHVGIDSTLFSTRTAAQITQNVAVGTGAARGCQPGSLSNTGPSYDLTPTFSAGESFSVGMHGFGGHNPTCSARWTFRPESLANPDNPLTPASTQFVAENVLQNPEGLTVPNCNANGDMTTMLTLPEDIEPGRHILQLVTSDNANGISPNEWFSCALFDVCSNRSDECVPRQCEALNQGGMLGIDDCPMMLCVTEETFNDCTTTYTPDGFCNVGTATCECTPRTECSGSCGTESDGCGGMIECGGCGEGEFCEGAPATCVSGAPEECVPIVVDCEVEANGVMDGRCGIVSDGCGAVVDCGQCSTESEFSTCFNTECVNSDFLTLSATVTQAPTDPTGNPASSVSASIALSVAAVGALLL